ncbi:hypothetical protein FGF1_41160 [Flavobacteriaceae bacterium GF1]
MEFLNPQIAKLAKAKKRSLLRKQISCGIFQDVTPSDLKTKKHEEATLGKGSYPNQE